MFYTRQLSYPVLVTVYHMLECQAMDILSYTGTTTTTSSDDGADEVTLEAKTRTSLLHVGEIADWCIFSIEVRNTYGLPFEVTFERNQEGEFSTVHSQGAKSDEHGSLTGVEHASVTSLVPPGSTSRYVSPDIVFLLVVLIVFSHQDRFASEEDLTNGGACIASYTHAFGSTICRHGIQPHRSSRARSTRTILVPGRAL